MGVVLCQRAQKLINNGTTAPRRAPRRETSPNVADTNLEMPRRKRNVYEATTLEMAAYFIAKKYESLITYGVWDAKFKRGRRPCSDIDSNHDAVRSLATTYLAHADTDAWNVIAGAVELARLWALEQPVGPTSDLTYGIDLKMRMRLAVCLSVSWKFARGSHTAFPRSFESEDECGGPCTLESAFVAFSFMLKNEQDEYGGWLRENVEKLRKLQKEALELEIQLVIGVPTFPLLAENAQAMAELKIQELFDAGTTSETRCMQLRGIVPFFVRTSLFKDKGEYQSPYSYLLANNNDVEAAASALVCAAWFCLKYSEQPSRDMHVDTKQFTTIDRFLAIRLIDNAVRATNSNTSIYYRGCYGTQTWYGYKYVQKETLTRAINACTLPDVTMLKSNSIMPSAASGVVSYISRAACFW